MLLHALAAASLLAVAPGTRDEPPKASADNPAPIVEVRRAAKRHVIIRRDTAAAARKRVVAHRAGDRPIKEASPVKSATGVKVNAKSAKGVKRGSLVVKPAAPRPE